MEPRAVQRGGSQHVDAVRRFVPSRRRVTTALLGDGAAKWQPLPRLLYERSRRYLRHRLSGDDVVRALRQPRRADGVGRRVVRPAARGRRALLAADVARAGERTRAAAGISLELLSEAVSG